MILSNPFSALGAKIFGGLFLASLVTLGPALWWTRGELADARATIADLLDWQMEMVDAVRLASNNPDVDETTAKAQVQELGIIRLELTNAIDNQNAAIEAMEAQTAAAMRAADEAERRRRSAVRKAERLKTELANRAMNPVAPAKMEQAVRDAQDILFEEGI